MTTFSAIIGSIFVIGSQTNLGLGLDEIVQAHMASVLSIRSLEMRGRHFQVDGNASLVEIERYEFRMSGDEERLTLDRAGIPPTDSGDRMGYFDMYNGKDLYKSIVGYDPTRPPRLGESSLSSSHGTLGRRFTGSTRPTSLPRNQLLLEIAHGTNSWTLQQLVATSTASLVAAPSSSSRHCYEIEVKRPEIAFRISIDPTVNFMVRRLEVLPTPGTKIKVSVVFEVESFQDCGMGIYLPTSINTEMKEANGKTTKGKMKWEVVSCNRALGPEVFEVAFPDGLCVVDQRSGKIHYWGPDDKPRLTFDNAEEHRRWRLPRLNKAMQARYARPFPWSLVLGGITAAFVLILILRKRARARRAAA